MTLVCRDPYYGAQRFSNISSLSKNATSGSRLWLGKIIGVFRGGSGFKPSQLIWSFSKKSLKMHRNTPRINGTPKIHLRFFGVASLYKINLRRPSHVWSTVCLVPFVLLASLLYLANSALVLVSYFLCIVAFGLVIAALLLYLITSCSFVLVASLLCLVDLVSMWSSVVNSAVCGCPTQSHSLISFVDCRR